MRGAGGSPKEGTSADQPPTIEGVVVRHADRALSAVGVIPLLLALGAGGVAGLLLSFSAAALCAVATAGFAGVLEVFHRNRTTLAHEQCQVTTAKADAFYNRLLIDNNWTPKVVDQFLYGGFRFDRLGFQETPAAITVGGPFCAACGAEVHFTCRVLFPGRIRFYSHCYCASPKPQTQPPAELVQVAIALSRTLN